MLEEGPQEPGRRQRPNRGPASPQGSVRPGHLWKAPPRITARPASRRGNQRDPSFARKARGNLSATAPRRVQRKVPGTEEKKLLSHAA